MLPGAVFHRTPWHATLDARCVYVKSGVTIGGDNLGVTGLPSRAVDGIDYIGERGLGPWIKRRRERMKLTATDLAQAATLGNRTINRYENDQGLGYETLRVLDALGVKWSSGPMKDAPASVNRELRDLRLVLEERGAVDPPAWPADLMRRLEALEDRVEKLATREDLERGLDALREAIASRASRDTPRANPGAAE